LNLNIPQSEEQNPQTDETLTIMHSHINSK
jgi:hypothetical protein